MREIKFRAWDKKDGMMFCDIQQGICFDDESHYSFGNFLEKQSDDYHEWEVMQCTGVRDKNGKEMYEGDVVNYSGFVGKIVWRGEDYAGFAIQVEANEKEHFYYVSRTGEQGEVIPKIIGNIYENPELIK